MELRRHFRNTVAVHANARHLQMFSVLTETTLGRFVTLFSVYNRCRFRGGNRKAELDHDSLRLGGSPSGPPSPSQILLNIDLTFKYFSVKQNAARRPPPPRAPAPPEAAIAVAFAFLDDRSWKNCDFYEIRICLIKEILLIGLCYRFNEVSGGRPALYTDSGPGVVTEVELRTTNLGVGQSVPLFDIKWNRRHVSACFADGRRAAASCGVLCVRRNCDSKVEVGQAPARLHSVRRARPHPAPPAKYSLRRVNERSASHWRESNSLTRLRLRRPDAARAGDGGGAAAGASEEPAV
ncbi:hypothetical protein EVAR_43127_1 [Eumeta japonica]|uniref:Uncharacterized protein n=1 Tax=Eumeta variegata TaxID=151549 RepID=A0A4C1XPE9_EUMVA|nr:hypothetical protein EVAR_43127_1 [Eumeta japonica]